MPTTSQSQLSETVQAAILAAIVEVDQSLISGDPITFREICNRQTHLFGPKNSEKRKRCSSRWQNFLRIARENEEGFVSLLRKHNIRPAEMVKKVHLKTEAPDPTPTKMSTRSPGQPKGSTPSKASQTSFADYEEDVNEEVGTTYYLEDGTEGIAEHVCNMRVEEGMEHLNPPFDLVQDVENVMFNTEHAKVFARCVTLLYTAEFFDVANRNVRIKKTIWPNVLLLEEPWVKASLRADMTDRDCKQENANEIKEYKFGAAARNMKNRDENGEMLLWWCLEAWDKHSCAIDAMAELQDADGKPNTIRMKRTLLVFSKSQFDFHDGYWQGTLPDNCVDGVFQSTSEPFNKDGQGITRLRWLIPTSHYRIARKKIQAQASSFADDITRMTKGLKISEQDDMKQQVDLLGDRKNQTTKRNLRSPMKTSSPPPKKSPALRRCVPRGSKNSMARAETPKAAPSSTTPMAVEAPNAVPDSTSSKPPDDVTSMMPPPHCASPTTPKNEKTTETSLVSSDNRTKTIRELKEERLIGKQDRVNQTVKEKKQSLFDDLRAKRKEKREKKLQAHRSKPATQADPPKPEPEKTLTTLKKERIRQLGKTLTTAEKNKDSRLADLEDSRKKKREARLEAARHAVRMRKEAEATPEQGISHEEAAEAEATPEQGISHEEAAKARLEGIRVLKEVEEAEKKRQANSQDNDVPAFDSSKDSDVPVFKAAKDSEIPIFDTTKDTGSDLVYDAVVNNHVEPKVWDKTNYPKGKDEDDEL